ncbi:hypothetical protein [Streptomyces sp. BA2]|uniref:hypothetical protein n=1 Tax=Streptomyces sp. BA2 TaxID=436595 RepID=UPI00132BCC55|nr:hypothetical protein [Streptomyces sp. BA2]MWA08752.1 hypothetical protein [Streptomyces sp. BA2]
MTTPDYDLIDRLERELGIGQRARKKPMRTARPVCLIKDCDGTNTDISTWSGVLVMRIHEH